MIILCDVDGVLADFVGGVLDALEAKGHPRRHESEFTDWHLNTVLTEQETKDWYDACGAPGFARFLRHYPGAYDFVDELNRLGDVYAVTSPWDSSPTWDNERKDWLEGSIPRRKVIMCPSRAKRLVRGDVLIEDNMRNAAEWSEAHPKGTAILLSRPWNQGPLPGRVMRCNSYAAILGLLDIGYQAEIADAALVVRAAREFHGT